MQIKRQHAVRTRLGDQIGDQLGGNRRARAGFAVLTGIAEIRQHRRHPAGRGAAQRIERDQQFHQIVVGRIGGALDDEHILTADVLVDFHEDFHIGKAPHRGLGQRQVERGGDSFCQRTIAVAGDDFHAGSVQGWQVKGVTARTVFAQWS